MYPCENCPFIAERKYDEESDSISNDDEKSEKKVEDFENMFRNPPFMPGPYYGFPRPFYPVPYYPRPIFYPMPFYPRPMPGLPFLTGLALGGLLF